MTALGAEYDHEQVEDLERIVAAHSGQDDAGNCAFCGRPVTCSARRRAEAGLFAIGFQRAGQR